MNTNKSKKEKKRDRKTQIELAPSLSSLGVKF